MSSVINITFNDCTDCCLFIARFTKNLGPDKINVSTLKGEGELTGLELDEEVLMELLDLPTWLAVTRAVCNRVAIKVCSIMHV